MSRPDYIANCVDTKILDAITNPLDYDLYKMCAAGWDDDSFFDSPGSKVSNLEHIPCIKRLVQIEEWGKSLGSIYTEYLTRPAIEDDNRLLGMLNDKYAVDIFPGAGGWSHYTFDTEEVEVFLSRIQYLPKETAAIPYKRVGGEHSYHNRPYSFEQVWQFHKKYVDLLQHTVRNNMSLFVWLI